MGLLKISVAGVAGHDALQQGLTACDRMSAADRADDQGS
jgi:hypothetical protein